MRAGLILLVSLLTPVSLAAEAYKPDAGPFDVTVAEDVIVAGDRALSLRVSYPAAGGPYPVVVLSHGGGCVAGSYSLVGDHWASHGYVVIQPTHPDSRSTGFDMAAAQPRQMEGIIRQRVQDMSLVLDHLGDLEDVLPLLADKMDQETVIAAGHSMGGATALLATGMVLENPFSKQQIKSNESRYDALLLLSEPGGNPTLPDEPWRSVDLPTFIYTGTDDYGSESGENSNIPFQYAIVNEAPDPAPRRHYLWIEGINHYLSGAWCRDPLAPDYDAEAVSILKGASTAFLDAYAKGDADAQAFLSAGALPPAAGSRPSLRTP